MTIFFSSASIGDTNALLKVAEQTLTQSSEDLLFLTTDVPAQEVIDRLSLDHPLKKAADRVKFLNGSALKQLELDSYFASASISAALIGTPSSSNDLYLAIAEKLTKQLDKDSLYIYDDYLFNEKKHTKYIELSKQPDWALNVGWLVPTLLSRAELKEVNSKISVEAVGHVEIDKALSSSTISATEIADIRKSLAMEDKSTFLLMSCIKDIDQDSQLLSNLLATLAEDKDKYANVQVRIGLHPAANLETYVNDLTRIINKFETSIAEKVKIIVPPSFTTPLKEGEKAKLDLIKVTDKSRICEAKISTEQAAYAANGVACAVPATIATTNLIRGNLSYSLDEDKKPFVYPERFFSGKKGLKTFFEKLMEHKPKKLTRKDVGVPEEQAATVMAGKLAKK